MICNLGTRRHFLAAQAMGIGSVALAWLFQQEGLLAADDSSKSKTIRPELETQSFDLKPKSAHFAPKATAMISLFMQGGPSQVDLFDPKPELQKRNGQPFPGKIKYDNAAQASAKILGSPWKFSKHGQCGMDLSELLPGLGSVADEICLIRSMHTGVNNHGQSIYALNSGTITAGRPVLGSWLTYGLGSESQNLPAYVVLTDPGGLPVLGVDNFSNGWLPSIYQGAVARPREPRIPNLDPPKHAMSDAQGRKLALLGQFNQTHKDKHPGELDLDARIASFELAARMQTAAKEAFDISNESQATQKLYGIDLPESREFGTRCLIARRLVERGVRFVQIYTGNQTWDHHNNIRTSLPAVCRRVDKPSAALVQDLKERGLLDSTLVQWGGEMGRLPVIQNDAGLDTIGRDHNTYGFSIWMAGAGLKAGHIHGATDEFGHHAVEKVVSHSDYHATILKLFGLDHRKLVYKRNGVERSLIENQKSRVVTEILA